MYLIINLNVYLIWYNKTIICYVELVSFKNLFFKKVTIKLIGTFVYRFY